MKGSRKFWGGSESHHALATASSIFLRRRKAGDASLLQATPVTAGLFAGADAGADAEPPAPAAPSRPVAPPAPPARQAD